MKHINADALCRGWKPEPADPEDDATIQALAVIPPPNLRQRLQEAQESNESLSVVRYWIINWQVPTTLE